MNNSNAFRKPVLLIPILLSSLAYAQPSSVYIDIAINEGLIYTYRGMYFPAQKVQYANGTYINYMNVLIPNSIYKDSPARRYIESYYNRVDNLCPKCIFIPQGNMHDLAPNAINVGDEDKCEAEKHSLNIDYSRYKQLSDTLNQDLNNLLGNDHIDKIKKGVHVHYTNREVLNHIRETSGQYTAYNKILVPNDGGDTLTKLRILTAKFKQRLPHICPGCIDLADPDCEKKK